MIRTSLAILALSLAVACSGGGGDVLKSDAEEPDPGTDPAPPEETGLPESLAQSVSNFSFSADGSTVTVEVNGLDTTPTEAEFARNPALDIPGYRAYTVQEDALDRLFVALGAQSADGDTYAATVSDGGQFNRVIQGGYYARDGAYDPPDIGTGPGAGQVSYAGGYAGITNIASSAGSELLPIPPGTDPSTLPDLPGQPATVRGTIFLNANFADNRVNGEIYNRVLISPIDGSDAEVLQDITLIITDIDDNGEFFGDVEITGILDDDIGDYGGIFGGENASSVAGLVSIEDFTDTYDNELEVGVFVLTQCGQPGDAAVCDIVAP